ncbi:siroheme synthase CysG [Pelagibacterium lentulum]|uniref:Uroporphyrinogen-III C-methyltransferase n=1 Tax=Pelagibacterium lentulum TaxID=2029865 RepID=A0A916VX34_9HYPH|nr:siroheme synthase CysG [Pelagibacterium lentulum]GGA47470.1 uroporphyrinogen-III C-methyltransferase [Pelagibacterium lentulum]
MARLNTFPVSFKVAGRSIIIVGGDDEALAKARLAVKTSARVLIFADVFEADFSALDVTLVSRRLEARDLADAALLFVADHGLEGARALELARQAGVPANEVDVPENCDFFTPAIVDRAPISIAISSEGAAPVLARLVRARIEAMFSPRLGALAGLAGAMRDKVAELISDGTARRRYYEALVTSPAVDAALVSGQGEAEAHRLLDAHAKAGQGAGVVWLIGAGPGAEDLLTLRAQRLLQEADVIVHDQLVPPAVVEMGRRDADRISVGKAKGHHSFSQAQINTLIVRLAREGKKVARLKSGDPMVFGRAGEEIAALRKAGIDYAIVPGVTAALAAAADTATPVTLRKVSSGFVFATAHGADNTDLAHWASLARSGLTLGLYMGKSIAGQVASDLMAHGVAATVPVGIVVNAGRADKALYAGTIGALAAGEIAFADGPAIIFIGHAVAAGDWAQAEAIAPEHFRVA